jgi:hypothetical protein
MFLITLFVCGVVDGGSDNGIENEHDGIGNDDGDDDIDHDDQMVVMMIEDEDINDDCPIDFTYTFN